MERRPLYKEMAQTIQARLNCIKSNNTEWQTKHEERLSQLLDYLSHGSGINSDWEYNLAKSTCNKIVLTNVYDVMDNAGYYCYYIYFTVTVTPALISDIDISITGNFGKYQDIKDYLIELLDADFRNNLAIS